jgi:hypothetical protein
MPQSMIDNEFDKLLQEIKVDYRESARKHKAFERARKIKTVDQLMRIVLLYCGVDQSLREVTGNMTMLGTELTDQSVLERLEKCQPWLQDVVSKMLALPASLTSALPKQKRLIVADMTDVVGPGAAGSQWRVHLVTDVRTMQLTEINISDYHTVESLYLINAQANDLILADRAYCRRNAIFETVSVGTELILRYNHKSVPVYDLEGRKIDLIKHFGKQKRETITTTEVMINSHQGEERKVWLHCYRLSKKAAVVAEKKCRRKNHKVKSGVSELTLFMSNLVVVLSTIPPTQLSAAVVLELYRCRWQIELVIKRFKSLLNLDQLRTRLNSTLAQVWLYGKMLYVLLMESAARRVAADTYQFDSNRTQTPWRILKLICHSINRVITGSLHWQEANWRKTLRVLSERKRKRTLQTLPFAITRYLSNFTELASVA